MTGKVTLFSLMLLLCAGTVAYADAYDDCKNDCMNAQNQCFEGITLYDPTGIKEAQGVCKQGTTACIEKCHVIDDIGPEEYQRRQAEAAEKKRQEQERP